MSLVIGLTGGIGSGKSTVATFFKALQIEVVDADIIARLVVQKGQPALTKIAEYFGSNILSDGELNRTKLREEIFADKAKKNWLNELLHPIIREEILAQLKRSKSKYVILEAPLLFENNLDRYCDHVLVTDIDEESQLIRASARDNCTIEQIKSIVASQISRQDRLAKANFVINNSNLSLPQLEMSVIALDIQFQTL